MKVFKFGGASVKDAKSVKNVAHIMDLYGGGQIIVVISAMGKMTNLLETLVNDYYFKSGQTEMAFNQFKQFHLTTIEQLFTDRDHIIYNHVNQEFDALQKILGNKRGESFDQVYDQIVCFGELISSLIMSSYLNESGIVNQWKDAREFIITDHSFREGSVNWELTEKKIKEKINRTDKIIVTQGFIAGTKNHETTTLGREGSDYSAAIIAHCLNAESVTIWKDVPGVLNADPKWFDHTQLIEQISYQDAIELSYYGATVIHPKTIKPLQNKNIPLHVRSFLKPDERGTLICRSQESLKIPCFIFKMNQVLLSISPKDFSFIAEENLSELFKLFSETGVRINAMQNSAISFSVCVDDHEIKVPQLVKKLHITYKVLYNQGLELATIRHYDQNTIERVTENKLILLDVKSRNTAQLVLKKISSP